MHLGVLFGNVVGVVGSDHGDAGLPGQSDELGQDDLVCLQTVVLQFDIIVALAEKVAVVKRGLFCTLVVPCQDGLGDLARQAGGQTDQSLVVLFQQVLIDAGLGVKTLGKAGGDHLDKVFIAHLVFAQQDQVVVAVDAVDLIKAGTGGYIDLTADDRLDACGLGCIKKRHTAVHNAVIGDGAGRLPHGFEVVKQAVNTAGAVQQTVLGMHMQVGKLSLGGFRHGQVSLVLSARVGFSD